MVHYKQNNDNKNYLPNVSTKSLFLCVTTSRGENLLTRSTSAIGTLSEPRSTHHQLGLSSCVCAHWAPGTKLVPTFPSTAFPELPPQLQVVLCLVGFRKARFSTHVIYGDKAHMLFLMKHEPSLRLNFNLGETQGINCQKWLFEFRLKLIGKSTRGQSWYVLKSWYTGLGPWTKILALVVSWTDWP